MKQTLLFFGIIVLLVTFSCKKDTIYSPGLSTGKLKQIKLTQSIVPGSTFQDFYYDLNGRVSMINLYFRELNGDSIPMKKLIFNYNGIAQLPESISEDDGSKYIHTLYYEINKHLIKNSIAKLVFPSPVIAVCSYSYTGNTRMGYYPEAAGFTSDNIDSTVIINDNITHHKLYYNINYGNTPDTLTTQFEYDSNINPVYLLNIAAIYHTIDLDPTIFGVTGLMTSRNNLVKTTTYNKYGPPSQTGAVQYLYNSLNLPVKRTEQAPFSETKIIEYFYH